LVSHREGNHGLRRAATSGRPPA
jgi:hypothetical protein